MTIATVAQIHRAQQRFFVYTMDARSSTRHMQRTKQTNILFLSEWLFRCSDVPYSIRLEMKKWTNNRIEEILVSNSSLVSGLSEASGVESDRKSVV